VEKETVDKDELLEMLEGEPQEVFGKFLEKKKADEAARVAKERSEEAESRLSRGRRLAKPTAPGTPPKPEIQPE
jgi:hypothetical protein